VGVYAAKAGRDNLVSDYRMARRFAINRERSKIMKTKTNVKAGIAIRKTTDASSPNFFYKG